MYCNINTLWIAIIIVNAALRSGSFNLKNIEEHLE